MRQALKIHIEGIAEDGGEMPLSADPDDEPYFVDVEVESFSSRSMGLVKRRIC